MAATDRIMRAYTLRFPMSDVQALRLRDEISKFVAELIATNNVASTDVRKSIDTN